MNFPRAVAVALSLLVAGPAYTAEPAEQAGPPLSLAPPRVAPPPLSTIPPGAAPLPLTPVGPRPADADAAAYEHCMKLARDDPAAARDLAAKWHERGGAHPAEHCLAVALIGLKQYKEGALRLEKLTPEMVHAPALLRAEVLDQAAQAWLLAGDPGRAYATETAALALRPDDADFLVDRAEAAGVAGWFDKAIADLDRVLKGNPSRVDALIYRAAAFRAQGRLDTALADIQAALMLAPDSVPALLERGNIRGLRGDLAGARQDWRRVAELTPGSAAGAAAKANIARLDSMSDTPPPATPAGSR
jgi:tetratricopeptide (TPR) repeat protein